MAEKKLPHNTEAEKAVLGAMIRSNAMVSEAVAKLNVEDTISDNKVVIGVDQVNGKISTIKKTLSLNNFTGPLSAELGGTGFSVIPNNSILVGAGSNTFELRTVESYLDTSNNLATNLAVKTYID